MRAVLVTIGWLVQLTLLASTAYGVLIVGGVNAMGWFLILAPIPLSLCGFFTVKVR